MSTKNNITIWEDPEALARAAAFFFVAAAQRAIAERGRFIVALSGGSTPKRLYQLLATPEFSRNINWKKTFLCWSDERFVPHDHPDSNFKMVKENLLDRIEIPVANILSMPGTGDAAKQAEQYERKLLKLFKTRSLQFDWILLGMGEDGHTASLFPGNKILKEKKKLIAEVWVEDKKSWRITFTYPLINAAREIVFLVAGKEKATTLEHVITKKKPAFPSQLLKPTAGDIFLMIDQAAAERLK